MKYRIGWPFWKTVYKFGFPLYYRYEILFDVDCKRYIGRSPDIKGLIAECDTVEEVQDVIESNAKDLVNWDVFKTLTPNVKHSQINGSQSLGHLIHG